MKNLNFIQYHNLTINKITYPCNNEVIKKIKENYKVVKVDSEYYIAELPFYDGITKCDCYFPIPVKDILNNFNGFLNIDNSNWINLNNYFKNNYGVYFRAYSVNSSEYDKITLLLDYETDDDYKEFCYLYQSQKNNRITDIILHFLFSENMYKTPIYINIISCFDSDYIHISDYDKENNPFSFADEVCFER